jgi:hypothetical protein
MVRNFLFSFLLAISVLVGFGQSRSIHVFVALCDNANQGIVPVPQSLGNGQDPKSNLYWGALYGVKSFFRYKAQDWSYVKSLGKVNDVVLERVVFKHKTQDVYLVADAYDGQYIKTCTEDFLLACNGQKGQKIFVNDIELKLGGHADLLAYVGHDGLMEFDVNLNYLPNVASKKAIVLACASRDYFSAEFKKANATPLLWTKNLMAPEAYTLESAIRGWMLGESGAAIRERAAQAYHRYQKCGIRGARGLFATGFLD